MAEANFKEKLYQILKNDARVWDKEKKEINENILKSLIDKQDEKIIELLLNNKQTKEKFFIKIKDVFVLKQNDLKFFIEENKLDNSYTRFAFLEKIGLRVGNKLLSERDEVVLEWPFKDCILEGGMIKEDQKRNEIFFNEILARDEIDRLLDPKVFTNWKKYNSSGVIPAKAGIQLRRDENGIIKENLIIKGNNLLALHSLKKQFAGQIKLIYIDPPFNTGGSAETFTYNNSFNHSSWLTFMKNRFEIAMDFLREDGFIAIAIDHCELFYLGALADEIFNRENRIGLITIVHKPEGRQHSKFFSPSNEYMLVYAKNKDMAEFNQIVLSEVKKKEFVEKDELGNFKWKNFIRGDVLKTDKDGGFYPIYVSKDLKSLSLTKEISCIEVLPIDNVGNERAWIVLPTGFEEKLMNDEIKATKNKHNKIEILYKIREQQVFTTHWVDKRYNFTAYGTNLLTKIIGEKSVSYPKSIYAVLDTLKIMTSDNDIIMDFFAGSGTTGHAILELNKEDNGNRKFILVEQLDEHIDICIKRLQKVLPKNENFIYCELAKYNEEAKEKILKTKNFGELKKIFSELYERYFLNYNVDVKYFKEKVLGDKKFQKLGLEEQKKVFVEMLDQNQMYVNFGDRNDKKYNLSKEDINLSEKFYGG